MNQRGFTVIETAIVLVIIGLLTGGILKGQQMIDNAKYKAWVKQIDGYKTAIYSFRDQYKYLPGDFPYATRKLPQIPDVTYYNGNGNGLIGSGGCPNVNTCEGAEAIIHLMGAGLIQGDPTRTDSKIPTPIGGTLHVIININTSSLANDQRLTMIFFEIPARYAKRLDEEFDDGIGNSGNIRCNYSVCSAGWPDDNSTTSAYVYF